MSPRRATARCKVEASGAARPMNQEGLDDAAKDATLAWLWVAGAGGVADVGQFRPGTTGLRSGPVLLLPLPPVPAQLLAAELPRLAGEDRRPVSPAARLHGLSALPRAALALRHARADELLS